MEHDYGVNNAAEIRRRYKRFEEIMDAKEATKKWSTVYEYVQRYPNRSEKFIQCPKSLLFLEKPLIDIAAHLIRLLAKL